MTPATRQEVLLILSVLVAIGVAILVTNGASRYRGSPELTASQKDAYMRLQQQILTQCLNKGGVPIVSNGARVGEAWYVSVDECQFPCGEKKP